MPVELKPSATECPNCGTCYADNYCPHCAQPAKLAIPTIGKFLGELADKAFAVNGTLPLTLKMLLLRPGVLTKDYLAGRRARYVKPLNLYVAVSVLFFLLLGMVPGVHVRIGATLDIETGTRAESRIEVETGIAAIDGRLAAFSSLPPEQQSRLLREGMIRNAPRVLFLLVPLFAGLLAILYRHRYYGEHLLFALHFHSFAFLLLPLGLVPWPAPAHGWLNDALDIVLGLYLYRALRVVYASGPVTTFLRVAVIGALYALALAAAAIGVASFAVSH